MIVRVEHRGQWRALVLTAQTPYEGAALVVAEFNLPTSDRSRLVVSPDAVTLEVVIARSQPLDQPDPVN